MVEHCSATAEAMGSNPIEVPKFFRVYLQLLKVALIIIIIIIIMVFLFLLLFFNLIEMILKSI